MEYYVRIGVGYTYKRVTSRLFSHRGSVETVVVDGKATAHDFGVAAELPIGELISSGVQANQTSKRNLGFALTPSLAMTIVNMGDDIRYKDVAQTDNLPKARRLGMSVYSAIKIGKATLGSLLLAVEEEKDLFGDKNKMQKRGVELGILGMVCLRAGKYDDDAGEIHINTYGAGFSLGGAIALLEGLEVLRLKDNFLGRTISNLDLTFDYARYDDDPNQALSNTEFIGIRLSL
jgi:hypothetical protein